jgi:hypothetical protein
MYRTSTCMHCLCRCVNWVHDGFRATAGCPLGCFKRQIGGASVGGFLWKAATGNPPRGAVLRSAQVSLPEEPVGLHQLHARFCDKQVQEPELGDADAGDAMSELCQRRTVQLYPGTCGGRTAAGRGAARGGGQARSDPFDALVLNMLAAPAAGSGTKRERQDRPRGRGQGHGPKRFKRRAPAAGLGGEPLEEVGQIAGDMAEGEAGPPVTIALNRLVLFATVVAPRAQGSACALDVAVRCRTEARQAWQPYRQAPSHRTVASCFGGMVDNDANSDAENLDMPVGLSSDSDADMLLDSHELYISQQAVRAASSWHCLAVVVAMAAAIASAAAAAAIRQHMANAADAPSPGKRPVGAGAGRRATLPARSTTTSWPTARIASALQQMHWEMHWPQPGPVNCRVVAAAAAAPALRRGSMRTVAPQGAAGPFSGCWRSAKHSSKLG